MADSDSDSPSVSSKKNPPSLSSDPNPQSSPSELNPSLSEANTQCSSSEPNPSSSEAKSQSSSSEPNSSSSKANPPPLRSTSASNPHVISIVNQAMFIDFLPEKIRSEHEDQLNNLFAIYGHGCITTAEFELCVLKLIKNVPVAVEGFKKLLPTANLIPFTCKKGKTIFNREICNFNDKVRAGLYDDTNNYMLWLENLVEFNHGNETFPEFKRKVEPHFANMADLWMEFDAKLAPCQDAHSVAGPKEESNSDSSDQAPTSKARKTN